MWICRLEGDRIEVSTEYKNYGYYDLIKEPFCTKCSYPDSDVNDCDKHLLSYGFNRLYSLGVYRPSRNYKEDLLKAHILGLKKFKNYAYPLGEAISICINKKWPEIKDSNLIVPVPEIEADLKVDRKTDVRYNQPTELGKVVSENTGIPLNEDLIKTKSFSLKDLKMEERYEAVKGAFKLRDTKQIYGKKIILVDDVATALATCSECSQTLLNAGAKEVNVVVAGRDLIGS